MPAPVLARPSGVCLLTGEFPPDRGGVGDYTARLAGALAARDVPVALVTRRRGAAAPRRVHRDQATGAHIPVYAAVPAWDARAWLVVARALRRLGPRPVLHIQFQAGAFDLGGTAHLLPLWMRTVLPRARVVTTFHDFLVPYLFPKAGPLRLAANRLLARTSDAAIFTDPIDRELAGPGVCGWVVPIGSNLDPSAAAGSDRAAVRRRLGADDKTFLIGFFGFLNRDKGVSTLLRAMSRLIDAGRPVQLALLGADVGASDPTVHSEVRKVKALIDTLSLGGHVIMTGYLETAALSAALLACDAVALPFLDGASPRRGTLMAAIVHGVPIVTTRLPEDRCRTSDLLQDGQTMLLVQPNDVGALAAALGRLADDPELRARLAAGAAALAAKVAWPAIAEATVAVYAEVLGRRARRAPRTREVP